jgi:hypothetical protein
LVLARPALFEVDCAPVVVVIPFSIVSLGTGVTPIRTISVNLRIVFIDTRIELSITVLVPESVRDRERLHACRRTGWGHLGDRSRRDIHLVGTEEAGEPRRNRVAAGVEPAHGDRHTTLRQINVDVLCQQVRQIAVYCVSFPVLRRYAMRTVSVAWLNDQRSRSRQRCRIRGPLGLTPRIEQHPDVHRKRHY